MEEGERGTKPAGGPETASIRHLDERTVQRIAAGEVVERPASVVKELVENALDADADRISVSVTDGGTSRIRVRDDGVGIPPAQLPDAVAEHATSKIADIEDLDSGVGTLGFRGEALYTIGAVSRLTVRSRPRPDAHDPTASRDGEQPDVDLPPDAGAELTVEGGEVGDVRPAGCPVGTTVEVADLFFNTPARRKFLKTDATEFDHVNRVVTQYALANPDVAVSLEHDGRETFATQGNGDLESAVLAVYGRDVARSMIAVDDAVEDEAESERTEAVAGTPVERVHGLVSHPETTRANREYLSTFVNDRYVTASTLRNAVVDAYGGQLAPDRYPFAVLFVELPAGTVDVNVHPRKLEIRFDEPAAVRETVTSAVESALLDHGVIRSTAPRGRSAPAETTVSPGEDGSPDDEAVGGAGTRHEREAAANAANAADVNDHKLESGTKAGTETEAETKAETHTETEPETEMGSGTGPETDPETEADTTAISPTDEDAWSVSGLGESEAHPEPGSTTGGASVPPSPRRWQSDDGDRQDDGNRQDDGETGATTPTGSTDAATQSDAAGVAARDDATGVAARDDATGVATADDATDRASRPTPTATDQGTLPTAGDDATGAAEGVATHGGEGPDPGPIGGTTAVERTYDSLPPLRVLGQHRETYVVAESPDGLVLIDQHAADERVNYERLRALFADGAPAQALAEPVSIEVTAREAALFGEFLDDLAAIGFRAERAADPGRDDDREIVVSAVPAVFDSTLDPKLIRDVLGSLVDEASADDAPVRDVVDDLLADLACYPSVTGNTSLTEGSIVDLLAALDDCENPYACPHGRPVIIAFDDDEIADRFERDYPGHAGRRRE
ncbi:DNA mismatch repair endonuclease MutL [Halopenitus persicus]|uniref:DNA mismatch repair endonuclease MutL n=1 Tax=Halopenitus persicus TaxID=1048396 RepID=UPI000BBA4AFF|nr:DNA mismatch repair endonuclease MutL [Halopenitus persicus]